MSAPPSPPRPPESTAGDRALTCRCVLWAEAGVGAPLEELDVRRCPVGPILALDCPEWSGVPCRVRVALGDASPTVIARDEATAMLAALREEGTLSERYRRRLRALVAETPGSSAGADVTLPGGGRALPPGVTPRARGAGAPVPAPVGVPADRGRRRGPGAGPHAGPTDEGASRASTGGAP